MTAAGRFLLLLRGREREVHRFRARLYGSLSLTGRGHASDRAVILGLSGIDVRTTTIDAANQTEKQVRHEGLVRPEGFPPIAFDTETDLRFDPGPPLPGHPNGLIFEAYGVENGERSKLIVRETYYSIGGGFVVSAEELQGRSIAQAPQQSDKKVPVPFPFQTARQMLDMGREARRSIARMKWDNEVFTMGESALREGIEQIEEVMMDSIARGLDADGTLPGGLGVRRRSKDLLRQLQAEKGRNDTQPHVANEWLGLYAMAVNEENAAGGRIVTAPTNGAAGVVPAVLRYYRDHCIGSTSTGRRDFLLVAAAIGGIIKYNASISGAEVGCQGEVGSASAMAAAGLCAALGGLNDQVENAAEIALEHHLGMTCDPVAGLVQVPCIERNALGAVKAVMAASLALRGDGKHFMPLDNCIETMRQTGLDMSDRYKETSKGGLAVNLPEC